MYDTEAIPVERLGGRRLDAAVHREVFGRPVLWVLEPARDREEPRDGKSGEVVPEYSSDNQAGLQVTVWLSEHGYSFQPNAGAGHGKLLRGDRAVTTIAARGETAEQRCRAAVTAARSDRRSPSS